MGRELKRVPLDFKWAIGQLWKGFINPYRSMECKACGGTGLNPATKQLEETWYNSENPRWVNLPNGRRYNDNAWSNHLTQVEVNALVEKGRLMDFTHTWQSGEGWKKKEPEYIPTAEEVNQWNRTGMGHDAINRWICVEAWAKHLGVYGKCEYCGGEGEIWQSDEIKKLHDDWQSFEPPTGEGFQLWSTTTEGHPMTPVFATLEELCAYCEKESVSVFGYNTLTKEEWFESLSGGLVVHKEGNAVFI